MKRRGKQPKSWPKPADFELDPALARVPAIGAGLLSWQGKPVSMVCLDGGGLGTLFLFIAAAETTVPEPPAQPEIVAVNQLATASWTRHGRTYVLAAVADPERLREWLAPSPRARRSGEREFAAAPACHSDPAWD